MKNLKPLLALAFIFSLNPLPLASPPPAVAETKPQATIQSKDVKVGKGPAVKDGSLVTVHYTGWLLNGQKFDSSRDRKEPFSFTVGKDKMIQGWTLGIKGMKPGGIRKLTIPPGLAYGEKGRGPIPPNSTLVFEIEVLKVK